MAHQTQSQKLAVERSGQIAHRATKNIELVRKMSEINVYVVMAISYLHQALYLWVLFRAGLNLDDLHAVSGAIGAVLIPIAFDIFSVICIKVGTTVGLMQATRRWGLALLVVPTGLSGYVNVRSSILVENGWIIASIYIGVVAMIPVIEFLRGKMNDIDYDAIDAIERRTYAFGMGETDAPVVNPVQVPAAPLDPMMDLVARTAGDIEAAQLLVEYAKMTPGDKQSWTRRFKSARAKWLAEMADPAAAASATYPNAPVSPAAAQVK